MTEFKLDLMEHKIPTWLVAPAAFLGILLFVVSSIVVPIYLRVGNGLVFVVLLLFYIPFGYYVINFKRRWKIFNRITPYTISLHDDFLEIRERNIKVLWSDILWYNAGESRYPFAHVAIKARNQKKILFRAHYFNTDMEQWKSFCALLIENIEQKGASAHYFYNKPIFKVLIWLLPSVCIVVPVVLTVTGLVDFTKSAGGLTLLITGGAIVIVYVMYFLYMRSKRPLS